MFANCFTNSRGTVVHTLPLNLPDLVRLRGDLERAYTERGEPLRPPTYTLPITGDDGQVLHTETHQHDMTTLETPEDFAAWTAHQDAVHRFNADARERELKIFVLDGIDWEKHPIANAWREKRVRRGYALPADEEELRLHYAGDLLIVSVQDSFDLREACTRGYYDGAPEEAVDAIIAGLFPGRVAQRRNGDARRGTPALSESRGDMATLGLHDQSHDGEGVEPVAE